jgi:hypothetical protein
MAVHDLLSRRKSRVRDIQALPVEVHDVYTPERIIEELGALDGMYPEYEAFMKIMRIRRLKYASDAFIYLLHLSTRHRQKAQEKYRRLKETFVDEETHLWWSSLRDDPEQNGFRTFEQLFGVLTESVFDKKLARKQYQNLLHSPLKKKYSDSWYESIGPNGEFYECEDDYEVRLDQLVRKVLKENNERGSDQTHLPTVRKF